MWSSGSSGRKCNVSLPDSAQVVLEALQAGYQAGRLAHAYILVGDLPVCLHLAEEFITFLLAGDQASEEQRESMLHRLQSGTHPDVHRLEPRSKSRQIVIEQIRELNQRIAQTPMEGGWKAGIIMNADRMNDPAANAFLKTLEEPPGQSLLLLLTESPEFLLPTIVSRCQRVVLSGQSIRKDTPWYESALSLFMDMAHGSTIEAVVTGEQLKKLLSERRSAIEEEEKEREPDPGENKEVRAARVEAKVREVRADIIRMLLLWRRDVLITTLGLSSEHLHFAEHADVLARQAKVLNPIRALEATESVEHMARQLERNMPEATVMESNLLKGP